MSAPRWKQISLSRTELALVFLGCGALPGGWWCWAAVPEECGTPPRDWEQLAGPLRTQGGSSPGQLNWEDCLGMEADVAQPG